MVSNPELFRQAAGGPNSAGEADLAFKEDNEILQGITSGSTEGVLRSANAAAFAKAVDKLTQKQKEQHTQRIFITLIEQINQQIAQLETDLARDLYALKADYGEDVVTGIANTYLTDEELEGLETDEEKMDALVDKYLDENGNLKPGNEDMDPRVVDVLKKHHKLQNELKPRSKELEAEVAESGFTPELQEKTVQLGKDMDMPETAMVLAATKNVEITKAIEVGVEKEALGVAPTDSLGALG